MFVHNPIQWVGQINSHDTIKTQWALLLLSAQDMSLNIPNATISLKQSCETSQEVEPNRVEGWRFRGQRSPTQALLESCFLGELQQSEEMSHLCKKQKLHWPVCI